MLKYLLQHYIDSTCALFQDKVAIRYKNINIKYGDVYTLTNKLSDYLHGKGIERQDRVLVFLKRTEKYVLSIISILKCDAVYVPIDANSPIDRIGKILRDCKPKAIICDSETHVKVVSAVKGANIGVEFISVEYECSTKNGFDFKLDGNEREDVVHTYKNINQNIASILYTSGTTGEPKGVMISHLNIIDYAKWAVEHFHISSCDNILSTAPFHFDMSTFDIYCSFFSGATLCVAAAEYMLFPSKLFDLIEKHKVTLWKGISSLLMYISRIDLLDESRIPSLKKILFGGEILPTSHLIKWMDTYPDKEFYNVYGPTEATGISISYSVEHKPSSKKDFIPIGKTCGNTEIFIVDEKENPVEKDEIGEIYISGSSLSPGYWNSRKMTKQKFVTKKYLAGGEIRVYRTGDLGFKRKDGNIVYAGRKDEQIKYMGYRIELNEVELSIMSVDEVDNAAVVLTETEIEGVKEIVAFVELRKDLDKNKDNKNKIQIEKKLKMELPKYMVPKKVVIVDKIPITARGKKNKKELRNILHKS